MAALLLLLIVERFVKLSDIKIDAAAVEQGEWIGAAYGTPIPDMDDLALKVRGLGNSDFRRLQSRLFDAVPRGQRSNGRLTPAAGERVLVQCLIDTVLMDWDGVIGDAGPLAYSKELARDILGNPDLKPFRDAVMWAATQVGEQRAADVEDIAKN